MTTGGAEPEGRRRRPWASLTDRRTPWTLPLVIILIIGVVAIIDHLGSRQISKVDQPQASGLTAVAGGTASVHLQAPWSGFNPNTPEGAASSTPTLLAQVLPSAYVFNAKLVPVVNADLLLSVEATSTAPLTIVYNLNPKATWSDGVPVTADDFIYAWTAQRGDGVDVDGKANRVASTLGYRDVASVTGSQGGRVVTVVFQTPFTDWRILFDHMVPAHVAETVGWNAGFATFNPAVDISAGPFRVVSVTPDGVANLGRNPSWWGAKAPLAGISVTGGIGGGAGLLTGPIPTSAAQTDVAGQEVLAAVSSQPSAQSALHASLGMASLEFDMRSPLTSIVAVRQALAHLVDRSALLSQVVGSIDPTIVPNDDHLAVAGQVSYTASSAAGEYDQRDVEVAARLLRSAGFTRDTNGSWVGLGGTPLTVRCAVQGGNSWLVSSAYGLVEQLQSEGVHVALSVVDGTSGLRVASAAGAFDLALVLRQSSPFQTVTQGWYSPPPAHAGPEDSQNWSRFDDPQVEQLFAQAATVLNPVTGGEVYAQIDDQLWDQMVALPLFGLPGLVAYGVNLSGVAYNPTIDGLLWNSNSWSRLEQTPTAASG